MLVSIEIDLLEDFINPSGALPIPGAYGMRGRISALSSMLENRSITRIAVCDTHYPEDKELERNGGPWPDHAMYNAMGADIIDEAGMYESPYIVPNVGFENRCEDLYLENYSDEELMNRNKYYYLIEKQEYSMFSNPRADLLLHHLNVDKAIVFGVATEICVKAAVLGLQERNIQCYVVKDCIKGIRDEEQAIEEMTNAGAIFISLKEVEGVIGG